VEAEREFMSLMEWSDNLLVNIPELDFQHKRLVELINRLDTAARVYIGSHEALCVLKEMVTYLQYHFREEEEAMTAYDYPAIEDHLAEHEKILMAILQIKAGFESGEIASLSNLAAYLDCWLEKHIAGFDQDYGRHILRKRAAGSVKITYA
jgi:hemerythrin-like metal-binding protein